MFLSPFADLAKAPIQEACLLSMLRVAADCDEVPSEVLILVKELGQSSGKHIRNVRKYFKLSLISC